MAWLFWVLLAGFAIWLIPVAAVLADDWRYNPDVYNTPDNPFTDGQPKGKIRPRD